MRAPRGHCQCGWQTAVHASSTGKPRPSVLVQFWRSAELAAVSSVQAGSAVKPRQSNLLVSHWTHVPSKLFGPYLTGAWGTFLKSQIRPSVKCNWSRQGDERRSWPAMLCVSVCLFHSSDCMPGCRRTSASSSSAAAISEA